MSHSLRHALPSFSTVTQYLPPCVIFAPGQAAEQLQNLTKRERQARSLTGSSDSIVYVIDDYFDTDEISASLGFQPGDAIVSVSTSHEPTNLSVDEATQQVRDELASTPIAVVGYGGGCTLDTAKAISNLLTNGGLAEEYQGWDLVWKPGVTKFGVPTISGTGAESSRTCVISNAATGAKLGMNSRFSIFDAIVLDSSLTRSVPRDQYFYTGMDTYMHCIESLHGHYRNPFADSLAREALSLTRKVFQAEDMQGDDERLQLMTASCLGGMAIAGSFVGLIHPVSAALSVVLGVHHGLANCIVMRAMEGFYPREFEEFWQFATVQGVEIPTLDVELTPSLLQRLVESTLVHERPLANALGAGYLDILGGGTLEGLFSRL